MSAAFGVLMAVPAHAVGWPIPRGGSQSLTNALCRWLSTFGGQVKTSRRVESLAALPNYNLFLCDETPRQLLNLAGSRLSEGYKRRLASYRYGPGVFKVDYALNGPIPWKASECLRAATVHLGGSFEEIAASEQAVRGGQHADRKFVLLVQPSLFDSSRAPEGKHTAWAYCHVPNGSQVDVLGRLEDQIERFAPDFASAFRRGAYFLPRILKRWTPTSWEATLAAVSWTFANSCFGQLGDITPPQHQTFTSAPHQLRQGEACTACAATMRRKWRCSGWA